MKRIVGIDFGTTNSVLAILEPDGTPRTVRFAVGAAMLDMFRTVLCFWSEHRNGAALLRHAAGPAAVEAYLDDPLDSRLILSIKTYLAQRSFQQTRIFGRDVTLEQLVGMFLRALLAASGEDLTDARIVAGRPVRFAGESADDALGEQRLRAAYDAAGLPEIHVALEPQGAGYRFARTLNAPATVLIGDFGGGTSDFSVLRFVPGAERTVTPLGYAGIGIAGDTFDYRIIDRVISPRLGKGSDYTIMGKRLPVPPDYFSAFARWHRLSLMRTPRTLREIEQVAAASDDPSLLRGLIRIIQDELGYQLYQVVSGAKAALSQSDSTHLRFDHRDLRIDATITRAEFESWIAPDLARIAATVDQALQQASLGAGSIDHVFLTGGTSFVPSVRRLFAERFGEARITAGGEFVSVAEGLALIGRDAS